VEFIDRMAVDNVRDSEVNYAFQESASPCRRCRRISCLLLAAALHGGPSSLDVKYVGIRRRAGVVMNTK